MSPSLFNGNEEKAITATRISLSQAVNRVPSQLLLPTLTASSTPFVNHLFTACTIPVFHWFLHGYTQMTTLNQPSSADNLAFDYFLDLPFRGKKRHRCFNFHFDRLSLLFFSFVATRPPKHSYFVVLLYTNNNQKQILIKLFASRKQKNECCIIFLQQQ